MTATRPPHPCPGGCGRPVPRSMFACPGCWERLPQGLRREIDRTYRKGTTHDHIDAMNAARDWYRDNPRPHTITPARP